MNASKILHGKLPRYGSCQLISCTVQYSTKTAYKLPTNMLRGIVQFKQYLVVSIMSVTKF